MRFDVVAYERYDYKQNGVVKTINAMGTDILVIRIKCQLNIFGSHCFDSVKEVVVNFLRFKLELGLADFSLDLVNELNHSLDFLMTGLDSFKHSLVVNFISTCFDHDDLFHCTCNSEVEVVISSLSECRIQNDFAVNQSYADTCNRACPRDIGNRDCDGCCEHTCDFR